MNEKYIRLDRYIEKSLYHSPNGYYEQPEDSRRDFLTAPEISFLFGKFIAHRLAEVAKINKLSKFSVVDLGSGNGILASKIYKVLTKEGFNPRVFAVEKALQRRKKIKKLNKHLRVKESLLKIKPRKNTFFTANEFFDALPIRAFRKNDKNLEEAFFNTEDTNIIFRKTKINPDVKKDITRLLAALPDKAVIEYSKKAKEILSYISLFNSSYVIIFDYGYTQSEIERFKDGSLMAYKDMRAYDNISEAPKPCDITHHVNFTFLKRELEKAGFSVSAVKSQGRFLIENGIEKIISGKNDKIEAFKKLVLPGYMGDEFKVLTAVKGLKTGLNTS